MLKRLNRLIFKARRDHKHYLIVVYKYGIKVPNNFDNILRLDKESVNDLWQNDIYKYIERVEVSLKFIKE